MHPGAVRGPSSSCHLSQRVIHHLMDIHTKRMRGGRYKYTDKKIFEESKDGAAHDRGCYSCQCGNPVYSSDREGKKQTQKVVMVGVEPFIWFRTRIYYFLIRTYFDKEFSIEEFTEGQKRV
ncbi:uncharacterized protein AKAME5_002299700 [Lates japonicus]|uniref:Uncharacterized protein n=1 Tax=Lates japonicus TaxID=270547 RepID=A0AAD3NH35_LATJO|nr:uncharacterized protein AKAME5_002299700 [Lates japonicus]